MYSCGIKGDHAGGGGLVRMTCEEVREGYSGWQRKPLGHACLRGAGQIATESSGKPTPLAEMQREPQPASWPSGGHRAWIHCRGTTGADRKWERGSRNAGRTRSRALKGALQLGEGLGAEPPYLPQPWNCHLAQDQIFNYNLHC